MTLNAFEADELRLHVQSLSREVADQNESIRRLEQSIDALRSAYESDAAKRPVAYRGTRRRSKATLMGLPLYDIATGPDPDKGEIRGHAKGIIAVGDIATGGLAVGGVAVGAVAIGGGAFGFISLGGLSIGVLLALGGGAIGLLALGDGTIGAIAIGGAAFGVVAAGGGAAGYYAYGEEAIGQYVVNSSRRDEEALEMLEQLPPSLQQLLQPGVRERR